MTQASRPWRLKEMTPGAVRERLLERPTLIVPVGTTEQHGPHLPLGCDTIIVERLADDLSAAFGILRAPTVEYGVHAADPRVPRRRLPPAPHAASGHERTYRVLGRGGRRPGVRHPHRPGERGAPGGAEHDPDRQRHGPGDRRLQPRFRRRCWSGPGRRSRAASSTPRCCSTSRRSWSAWSWPRTSRSRPSMLARYRPGHSRRLPAGLPGSVGYPSLASAQKGELLYRFILDRISSCLTGT